MRKSTILVGFLLIFFIHGCGSFEKDGKTGIDISELDNVIVSKNVPMFSSSIEDTIGKQEVKTYTIEGLYFEVQVSHAGDDGTIFSINGWESSRLQEGELDTLPDGSKLYIEQIDFKFDEYIVTFKLGKI